MAANVLLYWPNIIGYVRFCIVLASWATFDTPTQFIGLYSLFIALDGVDGWLARKLSQCSRFGAWLDVVVDNLGRGMLWNMLFNWGWLVPALEWCVFVCNHSARGDRWKSSFTVSPWFVRTIMANGFRTPLGTLVVSGLHCLPLWLYVCRCGFPLPFWIQALGLLLLGGGRLLALAVEMWCVWTHVCYLISEEEAEKKS
ncbi:CDP-diacylglycerol--serine O-phosphatidyltransferase [Nelusetta ayraudi]|uniref:CDP-diacylglycerol--serine O-phosphatidyltransferase n=1 Tax=Nelusetta ayraudi TaxID=303726 RepID=UPI003F7019F4